MSAAVRIAVALAGLSLFACASAPSQAWQNPNAAPGQLDTDQADCMDRALRAADTGGRDPQNRARADREFDRCMAERGWSPVTP